jgi:hypothetical protein
MDPELVEYVVEVDLHRPRRDEELARYLGVRQSFANQVVDLAFTGGERDGRIDKGSG